MLNAKENNRILLDLKCELKSLRIVPYWETVPSNAQLTWSWLSAGRNHLEKDSANSLGKTAWVCRKPCLRRIIVNAIWIRLCTPWLMVTSRLAFVLSFHKNTFINLAIREKDKRNHLGYSLRASMNCCYFYQWKELLILKLQYLTQDLAHVGMANVFKSKAFLLFYSPKPW